MHSINVIAIGASGGFASSGDIGHGGYGAKVTANITVTPGAIYYLWVGCMGVTRGSSGSMHVWRLQRWW